LPFIELKRKIIKPNTVTYFFRQSFPKVKQTIWMQEMMQLKTIRKINDVIINVDNRR